MGRPARAERERLSLPRRPRPADAEPRGQHAHVHDLRDRAAPLAVAARGSPRPRARRRRTLEGVASLAGLGASIAVFLLAVLPAVRSGDDPLLATLLGSVGVLVVAVFVVHGFNRKSVAALVGTLATLVFVVALAAVAIGIARITGLGTEDAIFVFVGTGGKVDMPRLVLAGVVVGSLGALVDMAVGQASTAFELSATSALRGRGLYLSALNVGRDHIGSLVNTLALAYFGGALPLIVLISLGYQPLSVAVNSEEITQSIMAVLIASIGLVLCVPLTTAIATYLADRVSRP